MSEQGRKYDSVLSAQHGGKHYKEKGIQPIEYANANNLSFFQGNVVKYVTRYKDKKGVEDVKKAIHYLQMILEFEYNVFTDFAYSDEADISQEELKEYVEGIIPEDVLREYTKSQVLEFSSEDEYTQAGTRLWYPPVEDGGNPWIEWNNMGFKPDSVSSSDVVEVLMDHEREGEYFESCPTPAGGWWWGDESIVAYRVV